MDSLYLCDCAVGDDPDRPLGYPARVKNEWRGMFLCGRCGRVTNPAPYHPNSIFSKECDMCDLLYTVSFYPDLQGLCDNCRLANDMPIFPLNESDFNGRSAYFAADAV